MALSLGQFLSESMFSNLHDYVLGMVLVAGITLVYTLFGGF